eukprot:GHVT01086155.1.p1 GENE.GHVT01086155.1~~GHVT01086155.1.p1  ORF type:complete len:355 (+),score=46.40 GHVT01086155.1:353-1417(+)
MRVTQLLSSFLAGCFSAVTGAHAAAAVHAASAQLLLLHLEITRPIQAEKQHRRQAHYVVFRQTSMACTRFNMTACPFDSGPLAYAAIRCDAAETYADTCGVAIYRSNGDCLMGGRRLPFLGLQGNDGRGTARRTPSTDLRRQKSLGASSAALPQVGVLANFPVESKLARAMRFILSILRLGRRPDVPTDPSFTVPSLGFPAHCSVGRHEALNGSLLGKGPTLSNHSGAVVLPSVGPVAGAERCGEAKAASKQRSITSFIIHPRSVTFANPAQPPCGEDGEVQVSVPSGGQLKVQNVDNFGEAEASDNRTGGRRRRLMCAIIYLTSLAVLFAIRKRLRKRALSVVECTTGKSQSA